MSSSTNSLASDAGGSEVSAIVERDSASYDGASDSVSVHGSDSARNELRQTLTATALPRFQLKRPDRSGLSGGEWFQTTLGADRMASSALARMVSVTQLDPARVRHAWVPPVRKESIQELVAGDGENAIVATYLGADSNPRMLVTARAVDSIRKGGFKLVSKAYEPYTDRLYAVKEPRLDKIRCWQHNLAGFRLQRELEGDVSVPKAVFESMNPLFPFLVEEWFEHSLHDFVDGYKDNEADLVPTALLFAREIDALHRCRVLHGDIKPENLLLDVVQGHVAVADDGEVPSIERVALGDFDFAVRTFGRFVSRVRFGTKAYLSPEVCLRNEYSFASDVYAFGVVLFELLTGRGWNAAGGADQKAKGEWKQALRRTAKSRDARKGDLDRHVTEYLARSGRGGWRELDRAQRRAMLTPFDQLVMWMLHPDPAQRVTMETVTACLQTLSNHDAETLVELLDLDASGGSSSSSIVEAVAAQDSSSEAELGIKITAGTRDQ